VPTRQAAYSTNMHAAPVLAILTALGGKVTRLNGQQMLAATTGMVQGLNESSEQKYDSAYKAWQASFEAMKAHQQQLMHMHQLMLQSYAGRADSYQKAADAARRMTGDYLDDKQKQTTARIDLFKAQSAAWDKVQRINLTHQMNDEHVRHDMAQEARMKKITDAAAKLDPKTKALIAAEVQSWKNAKAHVDSARSQLGQLNGNLTMPAEERSAREQRLQDEIKFQELEMDRHAQASETLAAGVAQPTTPATPPAGAGGARTPPQAQPVHAGASGAGGAKPSQAKLDALQKQPGTTLHFGDGSSWVMDANGQAKMVTPPTNPTTH
jgi:hypothetical protein